MGLFSFLGSNKMELSDFIFKFLQTITSSRVIHDIPTDQFSSEEIERIHKELRLLRYILFYFFVSDSARSGYIEGLAPQNVGVIDKIFDRSIASLLSSSRLMDTLGEVQNVLQNYKRVADSKDYKDYAEKGYFYLVAYCLQRCGYKLLPERKNDVGPVTKEEGVFDLINQTYLAMQGSFAKTVRNCSVYFDSSKVL